MQNRYYLTKYSLTEGKIREVGLTKLSTDGTYAWIDGNNYMFFKIGTELHTTMDDAIKQAEIMRDKEIKSHEKAIAKLKNMKFGE
jgi:hypothetical protein